MHKCAPIHSQFCLDSLLSRASYIKGCSIVSLLSYKPVDVMRLAYAYYMYASKRLYEWSFTDNCN